MTTLNSNFGKIKEWPQEGRSETILNTSPVERIRIEKDYRLHVEAANQCENQFPLCDPREL